jgi:hypothetical protein
MKKSEQRPGGLALFIIGCLLDVRAVIAVFSTEEHDTSIVALLILGTALIVLGKMLPQLEGEFQLGPNGIRGKFKKLKREIKRAEKTTPQTEEAGRKRSNNASSKPLSEEIIEEAARSPHAALAHLSLIIEKEVRHLLAKTNWLSPDTGLSFDRIILYIEERKFFSPPLISSLRVFWDLRSAIIHEKPFDKPSDDQVISAIDIGLTILKMIEAIPHEINIVYHPGVVLFLDEKAKIKLSDVVGVILDTTSPGGAKHEKRIFPTRRKYKKGQQLSWEWSFDNVWQSTWYRDPDTKKIKQAWGSSAEFVGRPLEEIA